MKRLLVVLLATFFSCVFFSTMAWPDLKVFTCEPEWAALAKELGGDGLRIYSATTAEQDPHHIQARPSLIAKTRQADLLICSGAELELGWLPLLLHKSANPKIQPGQPGHFMASEQVSRLGILDQVDRSMGDVHASGNPHVHLDPQRMVIIAERLSRRLTAIDDASKRQGYDARLQDFKQRLASAHADWQDLIKMLKDKHLVVHHDSWIYLTNWLGMHTIATLEPKPGLPPSTKHLAGVVKMLEEQPAELIIYSSYQDPKPASWLSKKTGIPAIAIPATVEDWQQPNALIDWYHKLLRLLTSGE
jgi:zinc/manganese transport system substrate-binding protein